MNVDDVLDDLQRTLSVPAFFQGKHLFFEAANIFLVTDDVLITKDVYPQLAKQYQLTASQVEGRIRAIIHYLWKHRQMEQFGFMPQEQCPSNKKFFMQIAEYYHETEGV